MPSFSAPRDHLQGEVVARDHVWRRHVARDGAQVDLHDAVDAWDDPVEPSALRLGEAAEPEDDARLVLLNDAQAGDDPEDDDGCEDADADAHDAPFSSAATSRLRPRTATTRARAPAAMG